MKLTDPTHGLKHTALELEGDTLDAHRDLWDRSAAVDCLTAIVTDSDERDYRSSGRAEAELLRRFLARHRGPGHRLRRGGPAAPACPSRRGRWCGWSRPPPPGLSPPEPPSWPAAPIIDAWL
jgi:hypothetical protein